MRHKKIVVLTGAGMSAESGLQTFRDANGLWEGHKVENVATPEAWIRNQELVLDFYNQRRRQLLKVKPNTAHIALAKLEDDFDVKIITQNVDDLHERGGSKNIIHLHGELLKVRSTLDPALIYDWAIDLKIGDFCAKGAQLRPHIVWFGEQVPMMDQAITECLDASYSIIIGTSMVVYPAAGLIQYFPRDVKIFYIDPHPNISHELSFRKNLKVIEESATSGIDKVIEMIIEVEGEIR